MNTENNARYFMERRNEVKEAGNSGENTVGFSQRDQMA